MKHKYKRKHFLLTFATIVGILFVIKCVFPDITLKSILNQLGGTDNKISANDSIALQSKHVDSLLLKARPPLNLVDASGQAIKHKVVSVPNFQTSFPDLNDVQLATAQRNGLSSIALNREEAMKRKKELVYIGDNPFYHVNRLQQSIPYLVPRAAVLLNEIARAFVDSCAAKGVGFHRLVVTSVLRTREDVERLRRFNHNASDNSCHQYGTTFDIGYNKYERVYDPQGRPIPTEWGVTLKSILAEVLDDQRKMGTCYVKYESNQSCFHITAR